MFNTSPCSDNTEYVPYFLVIYKYPRTPLDNALIIPHDLPLNAKRNSQTQISLFRAICNKK